MSCTSENGRKAIVEGVNEALNSNNCATAITLISTYYDKTGCGTDDIRLARASAYACNAGVNFFSNLKDIGNSSLGSSTGLFNSITGIYPSTILDSKVASGNYALDALFAIQNSGAVNTASQLIYANTEHPGTLVPTNRTLDSNVYGLLTSMAMIGVLHNRYGLPNASSHAITNKLGKIGAGSGWEVAANMTSDGCAYAGSMMTFVDSISAVASMLAQRFGSTTASNLTTVASTLLLDAACAVGCNGLSGSGCSLSCTECPTALRGRVSCVTGSGANTDPNSCAAAGIIKMVNQLYGL